MDMIKDITNQKRKSFGLNIHMNLTTIGILIFVFAFSTFKSFLFSSNIELLSLLSLSGSLMFLLFSCIIINKKSIILSSADIMWILFLMLFIVNIALNNIITNSTMFDIFMYTSCILFLIIVKVDISYYNPSLRLIKLLGIIYACSAIFQYLFTDIYLSNVLSLFSTWEKENILKLLSNNSYTGFTNQTAHLAGYIVSGIGIIIFSNWKERLSIKVISIAFLIVLFIGLLLTAKRAHLVFMIVAILITFLFSANNKTLIKNIIKLSISGIAVLLIAILLYSSFEFHDDSPITGFINELNATVNGVIEGEDVTSGRSVLYDYSWRLFTESPIVGIGWSEFINNSQGLINSNLGSHPHNIYLQLLTELGIIGFLLFVFPVLYVYYKTYRLLRVLNVNNDSFKKWKFGIQFSFFSQTFFLLYGMTGNLLTDYNFLLMYFFSCSISLSGLIILKPDNLNIKG